MMLGHFDEAIPWFDKVLTVEPDHTKVLYNKGVALAQRKEQYSAAHHCFRLATQYDPHYVKAWYVRAHLERLMGKRPDAVASCQALLGVVGPEHAEERRNAAQWLQELQSSPH